MDLSQRYPTQYAPRTQQIRYGLVVRIPGSHPGGPGSIPGNGNIFKSPKKPVRSLAAKINPNHDQKLPTPGVEPGSSG